MVKGKTLPVLRGTRRITQFLENEKTGVKIVVVEGIFVPSSLSLRKLMELAGPDTPGYSEIAAYIKAQPPAVVPAVTLPMVVLLNFGRVMTNKKIFRALPKMVSWEPLIPRELFMLARDCSDLEVQLGCEKMTLASLYPCLRLCNCEAVCTVRWAGARRWAEAMYYDFGWSAETWFAYKQTKE
ncbi:hypothetical protein A2943_02130 [Candidatus Adlerbacteria bacterium RIFCSPLOWO2_01_FULL_51_16]|uniref:Uncharacterized protein n=1 Tax=Candidatus Adlerbacteria bacterium RIFCSPLOWO2_01_FULL_51_16 TaxID=1797243 RepID=A0A1F4XFV9_9BACT|nr:MAG: hypothetical protein A2943_02130 [Candidatus Adlerbacteria bacterium RIFCSPLOWO2_01_FULL_51_16]